jgi:hypothetical protein
MNSYWDGNGKHQDWVNKVSETMPDMYYTDNRYMNVFIAMSNIYYEIYNNGGGNIMDGCYKDALNFIHGFIGKFNSRTAMRDFGYLEDKTNAVFEKLMKEDLSFENYGFWNEWRKRKISMTEHVGEDWLYITCGTEDNVKKEFERRKNSGFEVV